MQLNWPVQAPITRGFAFRSPAYAEGFHGALDLGAVSGTPVRAAAAGTVRVGWDPLSGNFVGLTHRYGWVTMYRHLLPNIRVATGARVRRGQRIGDVGSTGWSTGPHLHLDLLHRQAQDPTARSKGAGWIAHDGELYFGRDIVIDADEVRKIMAEQLEAKMGLVPFGSGFAVTRRDENGKLHRWTLFDRMVDVVYELERKP